MPDQTAAPVAPMTDAKASAMLRTLFTSYLAFKKRRPKAPSEAKALPALAYNRDALQPLLDDFIAKWNDWLTMGGNLLHGINAIGASNPGSCFSIQAKNGRVMSINGTRLYSALTREDGDILGGKLTVNTVTADVAAEAEAVTPAQA